ncbi:glycosyltransferase family 4 protein [Acuticoccus sp.]|uniref:glycosyltransferase family 4 protein n=1 Tax=Acuticoccus sp. TaxID=1904378 RepID=UPI003B521CE2
MSAALGVVLLTWSYPPVPTGLARAAEAIATGLVEAGAAVRVLSADRPRGTRQDVDGVTLIGCAVPRGGTLGWGRRRAAVGHLAGPLAFRRALLTEHEPTDVIESTNWYAPAALLRMGPRAPILVVRHSTPAAMSFGPTTGARDRIDLAFAHRLERQLVRRAQLSIFNTHASQRLLAAHYGLAHDAAHRVVGLALDAATIAAGAAAPWPDPCEGPLTMAFVGRAEPRKGFDEAIGAAMILARERPVRLHLVGTDADDEGGALSRLAMAPSKAATIVNHGRIADAALHRVLAGCHLVLAPSRTESYGIVYREAAAFGRPLVACREDASAVEFVEATGAGVLADRCEPQAIAHAMTRLWSTPDLVRRCREEGLAHAATLTKVALGRATLAAYSTAMEAVRRTNG